MRAAGQLVAIGLTIISFSGPLGAVDAGASEIIAFRQDSRYQGTALKVASVELDKRGQLLLTTEAGELYSASPDDVDWDLSRRLTERESERAQTWASQLEAQQRERERAEKIAAASEPTSVLDASRRLGIDNPGMTVTEGEVAAPPSATDAVRTQQPVGINPARAEAIRISRMESELQAAQADLQSLQKELDSLRNDRNPDPLWASIRESRIQSKTSELTALQTRIGTMEREIAAAREAQK